MYFGSILAANVAHLGLASASGNRYSELTPTMGATAPAMAISMTFACLYPHHPLYLYGLVRIPAIALVAAFAVIEMLGHSGRRMPDALAGASVGVFFWKLLT